MSQTIEGVPESITREQYLSLMSAVGLDPTHLVKLEFHVDGIYALMYALDPSGKMVVSADELVKNGIYIPVKG